MGGEVVVLDLDSGTYYGLDEVGAKVWSVIEQPASFRTICDEIIAEYDVDAGRCEQDVRAFIERMHAVGLIQVSGNGSHP
jgi:hypothetical protein